MGSGRPASVRRVSSEIASPPRTGWRSRSPSRTWPLRRMATSRRRRARRLLSSLSLTPRSYSTRPDAAKALRDARRSPAKRRSTPLGGRRRARNESSERLGTRPRRRKNRFEGAWNGAAGAPKGRSEARGASRSPSKSGAKPSRTRRSPAKRSSTALRTRGRPRNEPFGGPWNATRGGREAVPRRAERDDDRRKAAPRRAEGDHRRRNRVRRCAPEPHARLVLQALSPERGFSSRCLSRWATRRAEP